MSLKIRCSLSVGIHRIFQFLKPAFSFAEKVQSFQYFESLYQKISGKIRMKHKHSHKSNTKDIQSQSQIEDRKDPFQILMKEASSKNCNADSDRHQYKLICDRNDHQYDRCHRNGNLFFLHVIDLHWLPTARRRCDATEKKAHR